MCPSRRIEDIEFLIEILIPELLHDESKRNKINLKDPYITNKVWFNESKPHNVLGPKGLLF